MDNKQNAAMIVMVSFMSGCIVTFIAITIILCIANDVSPKRVGGIIGFIYLQFCLCKMRYKHRNINDNNNYFRITSKTVNDAINDINKYKNKSKYPFIQILPSTKPSNRYIWYDQFIFSNKDKTRKNLSKPYSRRSVIGFRKVCDRSVLITTPLFPSYVDIKIEIIPYKIPCHWISYKGSSKDNGIIICLHGGGYVAGSPPMQYALCSLLSKLTGCVCLSIDYRLCPEYPLPAAVDDVVNVYKYCLNDLKISNKKISVIGESAGGGLSLLFIQYLNDNNILLPSCCWVNSPWTNLECNYSSWTRNSKYDTILTFDPKKSFSKLIIGYMDIDGNVIKNNNNNNYVNIDFNDKNNEFRNKIYSPHYGNWKGLCPIYFMVGSTEMLLEDTINSAYKAYENGVNVKVDIEPNMMHTWCLFLRVFPEAYHTVTRGADFILKHLAD